jgi:hypothetical protein
MKYLPTIIAAVTAGLIAIAPQAQADLAAHPELTAAVAAAFAIMSHWLPSPVAATVPKYDFAAQISAAIAKLPAGTGTIEFPAGDYIVSCKLANPPANH